MRFDSFIVPTAHAQEMFLSACHLLMCKRVRRLKGVSQISALLGDPKGKFLFLWIGKIRGYNGVKNGKDWRLHSIFSKKLEPHLLGSRNSSWMAS